MGLYIPVSHWCWFIFNKVSKGVIFIKLSHISIIRTIPLEWFQLNIYTFLRVLLFEGTTKGARNYLNQKN